MRNPIGIMQGRLSPPPAGRIQAFPWSTWAREFDDARSCGFQTIEWLLDDDLECNPLWSVEGQAAIRARMHATGVAVMSVCADYFMSHPFVRAPAKQRAAASAMLVAIIERAASIGAATVLVPVLESAEVRTTADADQLIDALAGPCAAALALDVRIGIEADLPIAAYRALVDRAGAPVAAYYDTGNAAAKGFDAAADLRALGGRVVGVHIKDRAVGGSTVPLGTGAVDFAGVAAALHDVGYGGPVIIQGAPGADYLSVARGYRAFVERQCGATAVGAP